MYSKSLSKRGLSNAIGGSAYDFRLANMTEETFITNVKKLSKKAEIQPTEIYSAEQQHTGNISYCSGENGVPFLIGRQLKETDGLITDQLNIALLIKFADCTPLVFYDPIQKVQATVHSGWRGTVAKIGEAAISKMVEDFHVKRGNILAYVGPSIDPNHYEVGAEVYQSFRNLPNREKYFKPYGEKYLLDMASANYELLLQAGISKENIEVAKESTFTDINLHSARQEGPNYQLNAMITCMNE